MRLRHLHKPSNAKLWTNLIMHLGMGIIYIAVAILLWFIPSVAQNWDYQFKGLFSGICGLYGGFRIYRAIWNFQHPKR